MNPINYNNRYFKGIVNSPNGEVDDQTIFHYRQQDAIIWATYSGGSIQFGTLVGHIVDDNGSLDFRYQHLNRDGEFMTGKCHSMLTILPDGRYHLDERWQWTSGDQSSGQSAVEEFVPTGETA